MGLFSRSILVCTLKGRLSVLRSATYACPRGRGKMADQDKAHANPTKRFFVRMITRDITLDDCILDLIDNSVDGAWRSEDSQPVGLATTTNLTGYEIFI